MGKICNQKPLKNDEILAEADLSFTGLFSVASEIHLFRTSKAFVLHSCFFFTTKRSCNTRCRLKMDISYAFMACVKWRVSL